MEAINKTKERITVVKSVGGFVGALQQIAAMRMVSLRDRVLASKRFVDEATGILRDLTLYKELYLKTAYEEASRKGTKSKSYETLRSNSAIIVITSNQGLCGRYNAEVFKKLEERLTDENKDADIYIIGKKGQEHYMTNKKYQFKFYPYNLPDNFTSEDLLRLINVLPYYTQILMIYSRYVNTVNRDIVDTLLVAPPAKTPEDITEEEKIKFLFEPSIDELIRDISASLRAATFQQQILDSRLAQFSAQMVGMQTASENAKVLLGELGHEYNKQRRKLIDKKIAEVLAGRSLW